MLALDIETVRYTDDHQQKEAVDGQLDRLAVVSTGDNDALPAGRDIRPALKGAVGGQQRHPDLLHEVLEVAAVGVEVVAVAEGVEAVAEAVEGTTREAHPAGHPGEEHDGLAQQKRPVSGAGLVDHAGESAGIVQLATTEALTQHTGGRETGETTG